MACCVALGGSGDRRASAVRARLRRALTCRAFLALTGGHQSIFLGQAPVGDGFITAQCVQIGRAIRGPGLAGGLGLLRGMALAFCLGGPLLLVIGGRHGLILLDGILTRAPAGIQRGHSFLFVRADGLDRRGRAHPGIRAVGAQQPHGRILTVGSAGSVLILGRLSGRGTGAHDAVRCILPCPGSRLRGRCSAGRTGLRCRTGRTGRSPACCATGLCLSLGRALAVGLAPDQLAGRAAGLLLPATALATILDAHLHQLEALGRLLEGQAATPAGMGIAVLRHRRLQEDGYAAVKQELLLDEAIGRLRRAARRHAQLARHPPAAGLDLAALADHRPLAHALCREIGRPGDIGTCSGSLCAPSARQGKGQQRQSEGREIHGHRVEQNRQRPTRGRRSKGKSSLSDGRAHTMTEVLQPPSECASIAPGPVPGKGPKSGRRCDL